MHLIPQALAVLALTTGQTPQDGLQATNSKQEASASGPSLRVGMIGLDTSHSPAFAKVLNDEKAKLDVSGCRVVIAYPHGSRDIESSASRIPKYTDQLQKMDVEISNSIPRLLSSVDVVLLETNDGRLHLQQFLACAKAGKPTFIDKPVAAQLDDVLAIYAIADHYKVPVFSSSSLRYSSGVQQIRAGKLGKVMGCESFSPCIIEKTHSDLYWYGIHGVETLYTAMGRGCIMVSRQKTAATDLVTGVWSDGRIGTFRGLRAGKRGYGGTAFGEKGIASVGGYEGYRPLVVEIVRFFKTGKSPVDAAETVEIYAFMEAAVESSRRGRSVTIDEVMKKGQLSAARKLKSLGVAAVVK